MTDKGVKSSTIQPQQGKLVQPSPIRIRAQSDPFISRIDQDGRLKRASEKWDEVSLFAFAQEWIWVDSVSGECLLKLSNPNANDADNRGPHVGLILDKSGDVWCYLNCLMTSHIGVNVYGRHVWCQRNENVQLFCLEWSLAAEENCTNLNVVNGPTKIITRGIDRFLFSDLLVEEFYSHH